MLWSEEDGDRVIMWMLSLMFLYNYHKSRDSLHDEHYETLGCRANEEGEPLFLWTENNMILLTFCKKRSTIYTIQ